MDIISKSIINFYNSGIFRHLGDFIPNLLQAFVDAIWARGGLIGPTTLTVNTTEVEMIVNILF